MANRLMGKDVYEWSVVSLDGQPSESSSGLKLTPASALDKLGPVDILFVCGGINIREAVSPALLTALRRLAERRVALGALCTGGYALAKAGLLDNFRATIHWENLSALREEFPRVLISDQLFTIDRNRFTCSGGTAPLDLMLNLIEAKLGPRISQRVSEQFIVDRVRKDTDRQYVPLRARSRRVPSRPDPRRAAHGGEHREAAVAREDRQGDRALAPPDRAAVQARPELRPEALLPARCVCAGRASCCCRPRCRSSISRPPAAFSRRRTSPSATAASTAIRRARSARSAKRGLRSPGRRVRSWPHRLDPSKKKTPWH